MPRRELLTPAQREHLLAFPTDEAELIRLYSLGDADHAFLKAHRGIQNRLGVAVQMAYLRFPGRPIARGESPPRSIDWDTARRMGKAGRHNGSAPFAKAMASRCTAKVSASSAVS